MRDWEDTKLHSFVFIFLTFFWILANHFTFALYYLKESYWYIFQGDIDIQLADSEGQKCFKKWKSINEFKHQEHCHGNKW